MAGGASPAPVRGPAVRTGSQLAVFRRLIRHAWNHVMTQVTAAGAVTGCVAFPRSPGRAAG
jgi:hypothetical protein